MQFALAENGSFLWGLVIFLSLIYFSHCFHVHPTACNLSLTESCPASLYYVPETPKSLEDTSSLFGVSSNLVNRTVDGFLIAVNCSCPAGHSEFTWHMDYTVQPGDTWMSISSKFGSFVVEKPDKTLIALQTITLDLMCCCAENLEVVSYKVQSGDTLFTICSRFNTDVDKTSKLNKVENPGLIHAGDILFIPEPVGLKNLVLLDNKDPKATKRSKSQIQIVIGSVLAAVVVVLSMVIVMSWRYYNTRRGTQPSKGKRMRYLRSDSISSSSHAKSEESIISSFKSEKAIVFSYNDVLDATSNFSASLKIGQGSYGSVYRGKLRGFESDVAIKLMKNTKAKEFLSELNILCRVHHINLIELIGYAAGGDSLFLVYEFAQNGALSDHLYNPIIRGCKPLSWTTRVQIALDAAKGLEYIHAHTKSYYVHRDVKASNILLDSNYRAKIADFGLVKLLEHSPEVRTAASRIVGTFGYLAPEYVRDGCLTTKSDVYSFGVVLMELLTGQPALSRDPSTRISQYGEHRSLVEYMLSVLENDEPLTKLTQCIDPNLSYYHNDSLLQVAFLSKDCVDDDWNRRPDMCKVVMSLSNILMCSREWEKLECSYPTS